MLALAIATSAPTFAAEPVVEATAPASSTSANAVTPALAPTASAPSAPSKPGEWKRPAGVVAIAGGLVFLGVALAGYAQVQAVDDAPRYQAYVRSFPSTDDACSAAANGQQSRAINATTASEASAACTRRSQWAVAGIVGSIAGVASLGLGIYWLATAPPRDPPALIPHLDAHGGGITWAARF